MSKKQAALDLVIEPHPPWYTGLKFITLVQYLREHTLVIVNDVTKTNINAYVLDRCGAEEVDVDRLIRIAAGWYSAGCTVPFSVMLAQHNYHQEASRILRSFPRHRVERLIGIAPMFDLTTIGKKRTYRKRTIPVVVMAEFLASHADQSSVDEVI